MTQKENNIIADNGKIFARKDSGEIVARELWLGINDSVDNYVEVDEPEITGEQIDFINI